MRVVLRVASGPYAGRNVLLLPGQLVRVGRTELADFPMPQDGRMSSVHFALRCEADACRLQDLNSTNGTLVNGRRIVETSLQSGDTVTAGHTTFTVEIEQATLAAAPSVPAPVRPEPPPESQPATPVPVAVAARPILSSVASSTVKSGTPYEQALVDDDPAVRREALLAAAWTGRRWLLPYCRSLAVKPRLESWDALWLWAVLGPPSDVDSLLAIGRSAQLGSRRFQIYACYGHPSVVKDLLVGIASRDPRTAVAAALAFTKITGAEIGSSERVRLPPEDGPEPTEFEQEFLDEACLPSLSRAEQHWQRVEGEFAQGTRWRRGFDLSGGLTPELLAQLDLEGRWEACLRGKYEGTWQGSPQKLERFRPGLGAGG